MNAYKCVIYPVLSFVYVREYVQIVLTLDEWQWRFEVVWGRSRKRERDRKKMFLLYVSSHYEFICSQLNWRKQVDMERNEGRKRERATRKKLSLCGYEDCESNDWYSLISLVRSSRSFISSWWVNRICTNVRETIIYFIFILVILLVTIS